ncbi:hypothetical protein FALCPG4_009085 [Fusarium falciforme]
MLFSYDGMDGCFGAWPPWLVPSADVHVNALQHKVLVVVVVWAVGVMERVVTQTVSFRGCAIMVQDPDRREHEAESMTSLAYTWDDTQKRAITTPRLVLVFAICNLSAPVPRAAIIFSY